MFMRLLEVIKLIKAPFTKYMVEESITTAVKQDEFGFNKYGKYLNPMDDYDWLNMGMEELSDLQKYIYAERYRRDIILKEVLSNTSNLRDYLTSKAYNPTIGETLNVLDLIDSDLRLLSKNLDGKTGETTPDKN